MKPRRVPISSRVQELKKEKRKVRRKRFLFRFILGACLLTSIILLLNIAQLQIKGVTIASDLRDKEEIQSFLESKLSEKILFVLPKKNIFFVQKDSLRENVAQTFPILENVSISIKEKVLFLEGKERTPAFLYCGSEPHRDGFGSDSCDLMDERGFSFRKAPVFSGPVYFTFYVEGAPQTIVGSTLLPYEIFSELILFRDGLKEIGISPTGIVVGADDTLTLLLSKKGGASYGKILFSKTQNIDGLLNDLRLITQNEPLKSSIVQPEKIEYIDVRYKDKVYYKLK